MSNQLNKETLLGGLGVLDLADEKGMYCTKMLAELGADVVIIENPRGSNLRNIGPFYRDTPHPERSLHWWYYNASKKSVTLNLEMSEGKDIFKKLVSKADILVEAPTSGAAVGAGLGYEALRQLNPKLILTCITNFGLGGPYEEYKAPDVVGLAMGGLLGITGAPEAPPVMPFGNQALFMVSNFAAVATLIGLYYRDMTGQGQLIDVSMQACIASTLECVLPFYDLKGINLKRMGSRLFVTGPGKTGCIHPCKDGYACCTPIAPPLKWLEKEGQAEDLIEDQRLWTDWVYRSERESHISDVFARFVGPRTKKEIWEGNKEFRGTWGPVNSVREVCEDPHLSERGFFVEVEHPEFGERFSYPGSPMRIQGRPPIRKRAPLIGEHNEEIYVEQLGFSKEEVVTLATAGVI